ncbi:hypothetical protein [Crocosphaera sp. XPORK-15E]|nr:hypothetical protein [Crocosphaera sp. XPORK-15E]MEA5537308.1 hypothetical protein [Crocosphaera sp. XPORK-15E]
MSNSVLETVIQQIEKLTPDEQIFLSKHLDNLWQFTKCDRSSTSR